MRIDRPATIDLGRGRSAPRNGQRPGAKKNEEASRRTALPRGSAIK